MLGPYHALWYSHGKRYRYKKEKQYIYTVCKNIKLFVYTSTLIDFLVNLHHNPGFITALRSSRISVILFIYKSMYM